LNDYLLALLAIGLNAAAQLFLRAAMRPFRESMGAAQNLFSLLPRLLVDPSFLSGMLCYAVSIGLWLAVLAKLPVSVAYPMQSVGYVIVVVSAYFIFGEQIGVTKCAALALIILGVVLLAKSNS
jgi:multidrug transporter EmrE-like cation transporter